MRVEFEWLWSHLRTQTTWVLMFVALTFPRHLLTFAASCKPQEVRFFIKDQRSSLMGKCQQTPAICCAWRQTQDEAHDGTVWHWSLLPQRGFLSGCRLFSVLPINLVLKFLNFESPVGIPHVIGSSTLSFGLCPTDWNKSKRAPLREGLLESSWSLINTQQSNHKNIWQHLPISNLCMWPGIIFGFWLRVILSSREVNIPRCDTQDSSSATKQHSLQRFLLRCLWNYKQTGPSNRDGKQISMTDA